MTLLDKAESISPRACRLIARKSNGKRPMSTTDIANLSGLSRSTVASISLKSSWKGVPIDTLVAFAMACGVNHMKSERQRDYMKRRKMAHLHTGTKTQRQFYNRLLTT